MVKALIVICIFAIIIILVAEMISISIDHDELDWIDKQIRKSDDADVLPAAGEGENIVGGS